MTAYIVFAHGSSVESANDAVRAVSKEAVGAARGNCTRPRSWAAGGRIWKKRW